MGSPSKPKLSRVSPSSRKSTASTISELSCRIEETPSPIIDRSISFKPEKHVKIELKASSSSESEPVVKTKPQPTDLEKSRFGVHPDADRFCCMACYDDYCDWPDCLGLKSVAHCCCLEWTSVSCKSADDPAVWRVLRADHCEIVAPQVCYHRYNQCCCLQYYCGLPDLALAFAEINVTAYDTTDLRETEKHSSDSTVILGLACCMLSCRGDLQSCCTQKSFVRQSVLCCHQEAVLCDPAGRRPPGRPHQLCQVFRGMWYTADPTHIVKIVAEVGCLDIRAALPWDNDAPCVVTPLPCCACGNGQCLPVYCCAPIGVFQEPTDDGPPPIVIPEGVHITRAL